MRFLTILAISASTIGIVFALISGSIALFAVNLTLLILNAYVASEKSK